jgi:hypothetical protein
MGKIKSERYTKQKKRNLSILPNEALRTTTSNLKFCKIKQSQETLKVLKKDLHNHSYYAEVFMLFLHNCATDQARVEACWNANHEKILNFRNNKIFSVIAISYKKPIPSCSKKKRNDKTVPYAYLFSWMYDGPSLKKLAGTPTIRSK